MLFRHWSSKELHLFLPLDNGLLDPNQKHGVKNKIMQHVFVENDLQFHCYSALFLT